MIRYLNRFFIRLLSFFPPSFIWIFSRRYIAGRTLGEALETARKLNAEGCRVTLDVLGEDISTLQEAEATKEACLEVLDAIAEGIDGSLSVKLSALGLKIDPERCRELMREILTRAREKGIFVRIDMEDATTTDATLALYRRLRGEFRDLGTVVQARLRRSPKDVQQLLDEGIANLRLCKGIYEEPRSIAYQKRHEIRDQFTSLIRMALASGEFTAIATHDKEMIRRSLKMIEACGVPPTRFEFQMLLGVTERLRRELVQSGYGMRVYVPFGEQWHAYAMRRLRENPRMVGHILKNLLVRG